ncbi:hypothetical protein Tco_1456012 [Tanacetum coccineum]
MDLMNRRVQTLSGQIRIVFIDDIFDLSQEKARALPRVTLIDKYVHSVDPKHDRMVKDWASLRHQLRFSVFRSAGLFSTSHRRFSRCLTYDKLTQKKVKLVGGDKQEGSVTMLLMADVVCSATNLDLQNESKEREPNVKSSQLCHDFRLTKFVLNANIEAIMVRRVGTSYGRKPNASMAGDGYLLWRFADYDHAGPTNRSIYSIQAAPFEALYGRNVVSPVCWAEVGRSKRAYSDLKRKTMEFEVGDKVYALGFDLRKGSVEEPIEFTDREEFKGELRKINSGRNTQHLVLIDRGRRQGAAS